MFISGKLFILIFVTTIIYIIIKENIKSTLFSLMIAFSTAFLLVYIVKMNWNSFLPSLVLALVLLFLFITIISFKNSLKDNYSNNEVKKEKNLINDKLIIIAFLLAFLFISINLVKSFEYKGLIAFLFKLFFLGISLYFIYLSFNKYILEKDKKNK
ncbi:MAG: hypothetical protein ABGW69_01500 [Nanoarchaeota archaeon]